MATEARETAGLIGSDKVEPKTPRRWGKDVRPARWASRKAEDTYDSEVVSFAPEAVPAKLHDRLA
jgi:hypothetical protein